MNVFYVYVYLDQRIDGYWNFDGIEFTNEPFYIGKGSGGRIIRNPEELSKKH